jgi:hypothetical protein
MGNFTDIAFPSYLPVRQLPRAFYCYSHPAEVRAPAETAADPFPTNILKSSQSVGNSAWQLKQS